MTQDTPLIPKGSTVISNAWWNFFQATTGIHYSFVKERSDKKSHAKNILRLAKKNKGLTTAALLEVFYN